MRYDKRNRATLDELAPNTRAAALKWYEYCVKNNVEILITDGIRTIEEQKANVARGASKTMKSYHLVGQAFDFVPLDSKGNPMWVVAKYSTDPWFGAVKYAIELGFEWGGAWKSFIDAPHMQFNYKGYGTDKVLDKAPTETKYDSGVKGYMIKQGDAEQVIKILSDYWFRMQGNKPVQDYTHYLANEIRKAAGIEVK
jgi:hypothetical protein